MNKGSVSIRVKTPDGVTDEQFLKALKLVALDWDMTVGYLVSNAVMHDPAVVQKLTEYRDQNKKESK